MSKTKKPDADGIIAKFMEYVLEHERYPVTVYKFSKEVQISEADFYAHFGSLEGLKKKIWERFYTRTAELMFQNEQYQGFHRKEKLLTFFYTFFEMLTLNRSYVLFALQQGEHPLKSLPQLKGLRKHFKAFAKGLVEEGNEEKQSRISKMNPELVAEGAWIQLLLLLRFWMKDESPGFERSDAAIEKSVNTVFDVFDNTPLDSLVDLGKFLFGSSS